MASKSIKLGELESEDPFKNQDPGGGWNSVISNPNSIVLQNIPLDPIPTV